MLSVRAGPILLPYPCTRMKSHPCFGSARETATSFADMARNERTRAMKFAVEDQLNDFSAGVFADANDQGTQVHCLLSGEILYDTPTSCVVEHIAPDTLSALVNGWLQEEGFTLDDVSGDVLGWGVSRVWGTLSAHIRNIQSCYLCSNRMHCSASSHLLWLTCSYATSCPLAAVHIRRCQNFCQNRNTA